MVNKREASNFQTKDLPDNVNQFCSVLSEPSIKRRILMSCSCVTLLYLVSVYHQFSVCSQTKVEFEQ